MKERVEVLGKSFEFTFSENAVYKLKFIDDKRLDVTVIADPSYKTGTLNHFEISMTELRPNLYLITWIEPATGNTVTHVDDFESGVAYTQITDLASKGFWRLKGRIAPAP